MITAIKHQTFLPQLKGGTRRIASTLSLLNIGRSFWTRTNGQGVTAVFSEFNSTPRSGVKCSEIKAAAAPTLMPVIASNAKHISGSRTHASGQVATLQGARARGVITHPLQRDLLTRDAILIEPPSCRQGRRLSCAFARNSPDCGPACLPY